METALEELKRRGLGEAPLRILDLCTGSGCILLSLLHELRNAGGLGTDLSEEALEAARENAVRLGLQEMAAFRQGDLWEPVGDERFDLIVSNPFQRRSFRRWSRRFAAESPMRLLTEERTDSYFTAGS